MWRIKGVRHEHADWIAPGLRCGRARRAAKAAKDAALGRRLLALAAIFDGGSRTDAARIGSVGLQTIRDWVLAFNAQGPAGLIDGKAPGKASKLNDEIGRAHV